MAAPRHGGLATERQVVVFRLGSAYYALPGAAVVTIAPAGTIAPVPGIPPPLLGVAYVYGAFESVLDLASVLLRPPVSMTRQTRLVITAVGALRCGLLVDAVEDVMSLPGERVDGEVSQLGAFPREYIESETEYRDQRLVVLDLERILQRQLVA